MEGNENSSLNSYYHRHLHTGNAVNSGGSNGLFVSPIHHQNHHQQLHHQQQNQHQHQHQQHQHQQHQHNNAGHYSSTSPEPTPLIFPPHSVTGRPPFGSSPPPPTAPSPPPPSAAETVRRKRGRPRKYGTTETAQNSTSTTNKKLSSSTSPPPTSLPVSSSSPRNKDSSPSSKKSQLLALGNAGQGFTPHVIIVAAGEDVGQKIMSFMQQKKRAVCILSASGSISNASLRQPAMGGNVTYEGRYEILSLSGSYLHTEIGGASSRTGGLSICLSGTDGRIVGGGVGGPLKAAGPVQVIVGSFVYNNQKEVIVDFETSESKLPPSMIGPAISSDHHHMYRLTDNL